MKSVRTVSQTVEAVEPDADIPNIPKFAVGEYVEIYFGRDEGHCFWVAEIRWNHDRGCYEYARHGFLCRDWLGESQLVKG